MPAHGYWPKRASQIFVKTRARARPPSAWITESARRIGGDAGSTPRTLSAAYASIVVLRSAGASW